MFVVSLKNRIDESRLEKHIVCRGGLGDEQDLSLFPGRNYTMDDTPLKDYSRYHQDLRISI
jgi:hypothetical protein